MDRLLLDIPAVCEATSLGRSHIYQAIKAGSLRTRKVGRRRLVARDDLIAFVESLPR